jgi:drug/metabolite transporter (DMT)-like permease
MVESSGPGALPFGQRQALDALLIALVASGAARKRLNRTLLSKPLARLAFASLCLLGVPALLLEAASTAVPSGMSTALFAFLPVAVLVAAPYLAFGRSEEGRTSHLLAPAILGAAGALLLLPFALPDSWRLVAFEALAVLAVVLAALAGIAMHRLLAEFAMAEAIAIASFANAVFFCAASVASDPADWALLLAPALLAHQAATALLFELPQRVLLLWLMRDISPVRLSARALAIPLVTVFEGALLLRPELTLRTVSGLLLLAAGTWRLLTGNEPGDEPRLVLR